ncbi:polysaccharide biosynthesis protein HfsE [Caulobacter vibrioides]|uniref:Polyisoprenylphosphate hexose-1-phosphotransferase hfsE n=1 Tax=Caulobacter vibrioides (strain NA1000 / CB15N) TaxID=565050 RepID=A0A0H3CAU6_CAUVN|nr:polysaccharide biosynthesis protein HfsE [Caulobacter vibrioides]YP_002517880.4 polyisoprenylphosphate hexose-1-phosphotransferase hfsE [Caulobacter vibrioides NA1000]ACL95972.2 polyisoprenylphosphate hexose-1-phosphotransferase hfsE [Caulobacter vibrioides NA1000]QXZ50790.1 polysaccharide biosynthesis protein HfsE [Caulobacter vibrioides]
MSPPLSQAEPLAFAPTPETSSPRSGDGGGDPSGAAKRGPFRPGRLVPSRARLETRLLARTFRAVDILIAAAVAVAVTALGAPIVAGLWAIAALIGLRLVGAYAFPRKQPLAAHMTRAGLALGVSLLMGIGASLATGGTQTPVVWTLLAASGAVAGAHVAWWTVIARGRAQGRLTPNIVVVGATKNAERLIEAAMRTGEVNVLGVFDDRLDRAPANILGVPVLGDTGALLDHRIMPYVDRVVIAVASTAQTRVRQLVEKLDVLPNPLHLFIDVGGAAEDDAALVRIAAGSEAPLSGSPASTRRALLKRAQDLVVAGLGLLVAGPVMLLVALAVKLDSPGPVFFRQRRHGFNNEAILVWKFRSMRHEMADASAARQVSADDDRVTRVGKFIRKTSLDELPQLFNVLTGEMSIVGPRPHAIGMKTAGVESAKLVAQYAHRHRMKPGVTGWAAIKGSRGPVDTPESVRLRVALDVEYIERQSFWLDLYIIAMTIPCLLGDRSAVR